jgi:hypothetical protein
MCASPPLRGLEKNFWLLYLVCGRWERVGIHENVKMQGGDVNGYLTCPIT